MRREFSISVTAILLGACVGMFVACAGQSAMRHERFADAQRAWGAIQTLYVVEIHDGIRRAVETDLSGPFDIWNGQWWRIPLTSFHHENVIHLVFNLAGGWYLGQRLERYWGHWRMLLFFIPATIVPVMAELAWGYAMIGFSGVVFAILGALVVLRMFDRQVAVEFPAEAADAGMAAIVVCWLFSLSGLHSFADTAHIVGFFYGVVVAWVVNGTHSHPLLWRCALGIAHLTIPLGIVEVVSPQWNGRYHWYQATIVRSLDQKDVDLHRAIQCDPKLTGAWLRWAEVAEEREYPFIAWSRLMSGLKMNRSSGPLIDAARKMWRHFGAEQRNEAESLTAATFGAQAGIWIKQFRASSAALSPESNEEVSEVESDVDLKQFSLEQKVDLPSLEDFSIRSNQRLPINPEIQNDASEGKTL